MTGYIDYLADEEQSGYFAALHGFCGQFIRVDPAGGHLGFFVALGSVWRNFPVMNLAFHFIESAIRPSLWRMQLEPALRQSNGQRSVQCGFSRRKIAARAVLPQPSRNLPFRSQVDRDR